MQVLMTIVHFQGSWRLWKSYESELCQFMSQHMPLSPLFNKIRKKKNKRKLLLLCLCQSWIGITFASFLKLNRSIKYCDMNTNLLLLLCSHYAEFVKCAAFVMRVQNYRCSEATIQRMALNNYWHFIHQPASSDWSSPHPPMSQSHFPPSSDYPSTMSDRDTFTMDPSSSSLYSSTGHRRTASDQHSSSDHFGTTPELYSSFSDHYSTSDYQDSASAPYYSDRSSAPGYDGAMYESSLPYICMGKFCKLFFTLA